MRNYLLLILMWLLMVVFAHEYVSKQLNQVNQQRFDQIANGAHNYRWSMDSLDEVVASFQNQWRITAAGLASTPGDLLEMSLDLSGRWVDPSIQQAVEVVYGHDDVLSDQAKIKFEFSNQNKQLYYDSPDLKLTDVSGMFDLNSVLWQQNNPNDKQLDGQFFHWHELVKFDAVVVRFILAKPTSLVVESVEIKQTTRRQNAEFETCVWMFSAPYKCHITNQISHLNAKHIESDNLIKLYFSPISKQSIWLWLLLSGVLALLIVGLLSSANKGTAWALVTVVFLGVFGLHQEFLATYFNCFRWPLLLLFVTVAVYFRSYLKVPDNSAVGLWFATLVMAGLILVLGGVNFDFVVDLPQYFIWAWVQQLILGPVVTDFVDTKFKSSKFTTACFVGVLFSIIHAPNHMLMLATLFGGVVWSYAWLKYKNLYANAFSHALLALVFYQAMPLVWLGSARIGVFF